MAQDSVKFVVKEEAYLILCQYKVPQGGEVRTLLELHDDLKEAKNRKISLVESSRIKELRFPVTDPVLASDPIILKVERVG